MISQGTQSITMEEMISTISEADIASYYLNVTSIPCIINSPLRKDNKPSFGLYSPKGDRIYFLDFATKERGGLFDLLSQMWQTDFKGVLERINKDMSKFTSGIKVGHTCKVRDLSSCSASIDLKCRVREWKDYDIEYWKSYGITIDWLKYAEVYPISHKIIIKDGKRYTFGADKYAYAYVEHKENKTTLKIYQPFNKDGYKWCNKHDKSVVSLWTKVPYTGYALCVCSSMKDALCVWENTGIPCIAVQGEGYNMSSTAINELKKRYKYVFVCFDNDEAGLVDGEKFSKLTGFINVVLPKFEGGKDASDLMKSKGKEKFLEIILPLFNTNNNDLERNN